MRATRGSAHALRRRVSAGPRLGLSRHGLALGAIGAVAVLAVSSAADSGTARLTPETADQLAFSTPATLSSAVPGVFGPDAAADRAGEADVVWSDSNGTLQFASDTTGGSWSAPSVLLPAGHGVIPTIAANGRGDEVIGWDVDLKIMTRSTGGPWSTPVSFSTGSPAEPPRIAIDPRGDAAVIWAFSGGGVQVTTRRAGSASWSAPQTLGPIGYSVDPDIAIDDSGHVVAVWSESIGGVWRIRSARRFGSMWTSPVDVSIPDANGQASRVVFDGRGRAVALWTKFDGANQVIQSAIDDDRRGWSPPVNVSVRGENAAQIQAVGGDTPVAVWVRGGSGYNEIAQTASLRPDGAWTVPVDLSAPGEDAFDPEVSSDEAGDVIAIWTRFDGQNGIVQAASRHAYAPWSDAVNVSQSGDTAILPDVATAASGDTVISWQTYLSSSGDSEVQAVTVDISSR